MSDPEELFKRAHAAMEHYEEFKLFFKAVELWINQEIDIENARLGIQAVCGAKRDAPRSFPWNPSLEIEFGQERNCSVTLSRFGTAIEAEIDDEMSCEAKERREVRFRLESHLSGAKAFVIDSSCGETVEVEVGPREIAKAIVAGAVRGYFV